MVALYPLGRTALERQDDLLDAQARSAPQPGTSNRDDAGSWPEPGERVTLLSVFKEGCAEWYKHRPPLKMHPLDTEICYPARQAVLMTLRDRYDADQLARWWRCIEAVLDRAEAEVKDDAS